MTKSVTIHEAKTNLSKLIAAVEAGEEVVICRGKSPVAQLVRAKTAKSNRKFGAYKGQATITEAFFEPLPEEELAAWEGKGRAEAAAAKLRGPNHFSVFHTLQLSQTAAMNRLVQVRGRWENAVCCLPLVWGA